MAATPLKTTATLAAYPDRSLVLIAGGLDDAGGGLVHATPEEHALLERACDEIARVARTVVLFGARTRATAHPGAPGPPVPCARPLVAGALTFVR